MSRDDVKKLLMVIQAYYPNYKPVDKAVTVDAWFKMLAPYDPKELDMALVMFVSSDKSGFAPNIGQLLNLRLDIMAKREELNEMDAWGMVRDAINNSIYHSEEEFAALPEIVQRVIGSPRQLSTWATDEGFNDGVVQSNFMRSLRIEKERQRTKDLMPKPVADLIEETRAKMIDG